MYSVVYTISFYLKIYHCNCKIFVKLHIHILQLIINYFQLFWRFTDLVVDQQNMHVSYYLRTSWYKTTLHNREFLQASNGIFAWARQQLENDRLFVCSKMWFYVIIVLYRGGYRKQEKVIGEYEQINLYIYALMNIYLLYIRKKIVMPSWFLL